MRKETSALLLALSFLCLSACGQAPPSGSRAGSTALPVHSGSSAPPQPSGPPSGGSSAGGQPVGEEKQMTLLAGEVRLVFSLNDSPAARELYERLPMTVEVENFSTNEKIIYLDGALDTAGALPASGEAGSLAYYAPWGNLVMFYAPLAAPGDDLFELGRVCSGGEQIEALSGRLTLEKG